MAEWEGKAWHPEAKKPHYPSMRPTPRQGQAWDPGTGPSEHQVPWGTQHRLGEARAGACCPPSACRCERHWWPGLGGECTGWWQYWGWWRVERAADHLRSRAYGEASWSRRCHFFLGGCLVSGPCREPAPISRRPCPRPTSARCPRGALTSCWAYSSAPAAFP